ncbi:hypothetical protein [Synechococcus sp. EJ6-Ellesmere]|uniref:hypothetical protein n=1 Tax=Synechococcus sp. EJ6-Ellesmere TaxID=2823734 RepID=UPI0020CF188E|nr:hypothetical protein [Synechococcus sp. EJ6-Ellesmere]MCP9824811.1 hypothetical protein [Synechococcus sp. EJ6-Ellesmere]
MTADPHAEFAVGAKGRQGLCWRRNPGPSCLEGPYRSPLVRFWRFRAHDHQLTLHFRLGTLLSQG